MYQKKKRDYNRRLNLDYKKNFLKIIISKLKNNNSRVSLFVEPGLKQLKSKIIRCNCVNTYR